MSYKNLIIAIALCIFFSVIFFIFPQIDLKTSALFYHHGVFFKQPWMLAARNVLDLVVWIFMLILLLILIWGWLVRKKLIKSALFLILCFALGPGLLVNVVLKNHWGRPRPVEITQFGGKLTYQKSWVISNQCTTNCSFVAGDPSTAFAFFALVVLIRKKAWRNLMFGLCAVNWMFFASLRIAAGGHFLSDVLIGATLVWIVMWLCYKVVYSLMLRRGDCKRL
jgi:lipid A 4'-phosphatase